MVIPPTSPHTSSQPNPDAFANIRANEDMDRLYKVHAMLTATQVSIQEFDPHFQLECERMATRERQRREERKKGKGKREKGKGKREGKRSTSSGYD
jgi:hypothetical protein